jgi:hypothetical protein
MKKLRIILLQIRDRDIEGFLRESAGAAVWLPVIIYCFVRYFIWFIHLVACGIYMELMISIFYLSAIIPICLCAAVLTGRPIGAFLRLAEKLRERLGEEFFSGALYGMLTAVLLSCFWSCFLPDGIGMTGSMLTSGLFRPAKLFSAPVIIAAIILLTIAGAFLFGAAGGMVGLAVKKLKKMTKH